MTLNYDETDDFDEADNFDEADDFDEESPEEFLEEDDDDPNTALSQAFREATAGTIEDYDDEEDDESEEEDAADTDADDAGADTAADADADTNAQRLVEPIDPLSDEEDLEDLEDLDVEPPPLKLPTLEVEPFRPQERSNFAYAEAVTAFYEQKNYQRAIEKFGEAIEYEVRHTEDEMNDANEIVAKSKYWQAEAYIKLHDLPQAVGTLEDLVETCPGHYLVLAAERRAKELSAKGS